MPRFLLRIWLDDRPGALGSVASRIGAVRGDLVGIEVLERGGGRAIDELVIELPSDDLVDLMVKEIMEVDGVDVEDVRPVQGEPGDARVEALRLARRLVAKESRQGLLETLTSHLVTEFLAEWAAVIEVTGKRSVLSQGGHPSIEWLQAFVAGAGFAGSEGSSQPVPSDVAWALLERTGLALVVGREGRPYRQVERDQLEELAGIAGIRFAELT